MTPQQQYDALCNDADDEIDALAGDWDTKKHDTDGLILALAALLLTAHQYAYHYGRLQGGSTDPYGPSSASAGKAAWNADAERWASFGKDIVGGRYGTPGSETDPAKPDAVSARATLYLNKTQATAAGGYATTREPDEELNWMLDDGAAHCEDCPAWADGGPYTVDTLPALPGDGSSACSVNCRCWLESVRDGSTSLVRPDDDA